MKVRVKNVESRRMKNENESEEEGERECRKIKKGKKEKKGKREALRRLINGPWGRGGANKHTGLHCAIAIVCHQNT